MGSTHPSSDKPEAPVSLDGFEVLDACHRQTLFTLDKLSALMSVLDGDGPDLQTRALASEVVRFFSTTSRQHHEDEERHVFPKLLAAGDPDIVQSVQRLQQDHGWLEQDWLELEPQLEAVAAGQSWFDPAVLREGADIFVALLHDHIALEESCIYPQARTRLQSSERRAMGREMAARRRCRRG